MELGQAPVLVRLAGIENRLKKIVVFKLELIFLPGYTWS